MPDPRGSFTAAFAGDTGEPVRDLFAAATDAWTAGLSALKLIAQQTSAAAAGAAGRTGSVGDPVSALADLMIAYTATISDFAAEVAGQRAGLRPAAPSAAVPAGFGGGTDISSSLTQALLAGATSTLRYWRGLAGVYARYPDILTQAAGQRMTDSSPGLETENRLLIDGFRAFLREIGEVAMQEARQLESELEQIGETLAHGKEQQEPAREYRRRWKAKD